MRTIRMMLATLMVLSAFLVAVPLVYASSDATDETANDEQHGDCTCQTEVFIETWYPCGYDNCIGLEQKVYMHRYWVDCFDGLTVCRSQSPLFICVLSGKCILPGGSSTAHDVIGTLGGAPKAARSIATTCPEAWSDV